MQKKGSDPEEVCDLTLKYTATGQIETRTSAPRIDF